MKPLEKLISIYEKSVGGNATMLLNIPPASDGLLHANDVRRLKELGEYIRQSYGSNLLDESASISASGGSGAENLRTQEETYYLADGPEAEIVIRWPEEQTIRRAVLQEPLQLSQRAERWAVDILRENEWTEEARGTVIGHKRIAVFPQEIRTRAIRIRIEDARVAAALQFIGIYG